jgi:hypothetical protein
VGDRHKGLMNLSTIPEIYPSSSIFSRKNNSLQKCLKSSQSGKRPWNPEENMEAPVFFTELPTDSVDTFSLAVFCESGQRVSRINHR